MDSARHAAAVTAYRAAMTAAGEAFRTANRALPPMTKLERVEAQALLRVDYRAAETTAVEALTAAVAFDPFAAWLMQNLWESHSRQVLIGIGAGVDTAADIDSLSITHGWCEHSDSVRDSAIAANVLRSGG